MFVHRTCYVYFRIVYDNKNRKGIAMSKKYKVVPMNAVEKEIQRQKEEKVLTIWGITSIIFSITVLLLITYIDENIEIIIERFPQLESIQFELFSGLLVMILFVDCILYWKKIILVHMMFYAEK